MAILKIVGLKINLCEEKKQKIKKFVRCLDRPEAQFLWVYIIIVSVHFLSSLGEKQAFFWELGKFQITLFYYVAKSDFIL